MSKPLAVVLALIGWGGVILVAKFHELVPNASEQEIAPFVWPVRIFAIVMTVLLVKSFMAPPKAA